MVFWKKTTLIEMVIPGHGLRDWSYFMTNVNVRVGRVLHAKFVDLLANGVSPDLWLTDWAVNFLNEIFVVILV